ncbi:Cleavage and polyadenylation specificity factor subunit 4 [Aix galericulata]|nr:Cleavage and polyadenylation specificity factor subunit 4 [Aix galericulata]
MCANYLVGFCPEGPNCKFMQEPGVLGGWYPLLGGRAAPRTCWLLAPHSTGGRIPGTAAASPPPACSGCWSQAPASRWVVLGPGALGAVIPHLWGKVGGSRRCGGAERGF